MTALTLPVLFTDVDGRARFREEPVALEEGTPLSRLSALLHGTEPGRQALQASGGVQFRRSPVGFASDFHCTTTPQWLIVLQGRMEIGLQDGSTRVFGPGECFYSNDTLPAGATFDAQRHGHRSRLLGDEALVTVFVRA